MSQPEFDPFDPVSAAMRAMHQGNMLAAKDAKEKNLTFAGDELSRILRDLMQSDGQITCGISRSVITATLAKWERAKQGQQ
jgi:hypothetical protein